MFNRQTGDFASAKPRPPMNYWLLGGLWALLMVAAPLPAADVSARIEEVQVGFRGLVEVGRWTPISIRITGTPGAEITPRVTAADTEGRPVRQTGTPLRLGDTSSVISMVYQHGPIDSPVVVELLQDSQVLDERTLHSKSDNKELQTVTQLTDLIVCLGEPLLGFEQAARMSEEIREIRPDRVAPLIVQNYSAKQLGELSLDPQGWESVDVCVISPECPISDALGTQLKAWVRQGGRLVLIGGAKVTSTATPSLSSWLPVKLDGEMTLHDITSLNGLVPASATLRLRERNLHTVRWAAESGARLAPSPEGPLVVRAGDSLGTVTAIALDINSMPFVKVSNDRQTLAWESLPDLCRWLAGLPFIPQLEAGSKRPPSDLNPTGVSDLQTQLINTLDRFPEVERPSYWIVLGAALLFMCVVGPLDYLVVHRLLKRPHWTWFTLPIWIGLGSLIGLTAASRVVGSQEVMRQLDLVTWDAEQSEAHLDSWLTIYSPRHHRYEVGCVPGLVNSDVPSETRIRWAGRPESGFRGLYRSTGISGGAGVELAPQAQAFRSVPVRHGSSVVLESQSSWNQAPPLTVDLTDRGDGQLRGTLSHQFAGELVDWVLVYRDFAYLPARNESGFDNPIRAGELIRADQIPSRLLTEYLVRMSTRSVERKDSKSSDYFRSREAYDPLSRDLLTLLKTTSFHQLSGGQSYTGLTNSTLQNQDLSRLVNAHRAVVFGRWKNSAYGDPGQAVENAEVAADPLASQFSVDGKPISPRYRECFVRWILPVKQATAASSSP